MRIMDPHIHMYARTTDDYEAMAVAGPAHAEVERRGRAIVEVYFRHLPFGIEADHR